MIYMYMCRLTNNFVHCVKKNKKTSVPLAQLSLPLAGLLYVNPFANVFQEE